MIGPRRSAPVFTAAQRALAWLALVATLVAFPAGLARPASADPLDARTIVALTNEARRRAGLAPVAMDERLMAAARAKLFDMLMRDYFDHRTPDGRQPWAFIHAAGYRFQMAAENLAKGYDDGPEVQQAWMKSRGHRANILNPHFTEIGVADANGVIVVMFGRPMAPAAGGVGRPGARR